jgi:hypothetical protein
MVQLLKKDKQNEFFEWNELIGSKFSNSNPALNNEIKFDSWLETENLFCVIQKSPVEYDLILSNDINTKGNTQWFYFRVMNNYFLGKIKFNIINLVSPQLLTI